MLTLASWPKREDFWRLGSILHPTCGERCGGARDPMTMEAPISIFPANEASFDDLKAVFGTLGEAAIC